MALVQISKDVNTKDARQNENHLPSYKTFANPPVAIVKVKYAQVT
jgi:hypothetical protein